MRRVLLLVVFLVGCGRPPAQPPAKEIKDVDAEEVCDRDFGVQYLKWYGNSKGGLSVRLDRDGRPVPCPKWGEEMGK